MFNTSLFILHIFLTVCCIVLLVNVKVEKQMKKVQKVPTSQKMKLMMTGNQLVSLVRMLNKSELQRFLKANLRFLPLPQSHLRSCCCFNLEKDFGSSKVCSSRQCNKVKSNT